MKKVLFLLVFIFSPIFLATIVLSFSKVKAQSPTPKVTISYPVTIPDVGSCNSWAECHKLCEDPLNKTSCYKWAVGTRIIAPKSDSSITKAMQELSCTSKETCAVYCADPSHKEQCLSVGQKYNLLPSYQDTAKNLVDQAAAGTQNQILKSEISKLATENNVSPSDLGKNLSKLCAKKENGVRCGRIADELGVASSTPPGPGGCENPDSCRKYCDNPDNFSECNSFGIKGPQGCTSELSCYQVCQSGGCTDTKKPTLLNLDPSKPETVQALSNLSASCTEKLKTAPAGQTLVETVGALKNIGVCELYDTNDTSKDTKAKSCSDYMDENSDKPFNAEEFSKNCASLPIIPTSTGKTAPSKNPTASLDTTCTLLDSLGKTNAAYGIMANTCKTSADTIKKAREDCSKSADKRTIVKTDQDVRRYCLSAPADVTDYQKSCAQDQKNCETGGYDWYCKKNPDKCSALIEGQTVNKLAQERFGNGINVVSAINALNNTNTTTRTVNGPSGSSGSSGGSKNPGGGKLFSGMRNISSIRGIGGTNINWDISQMNGRGSNGRGENGRATNGLETNGWSAIPYYPPPLMSPYPTPKAGQVLPTILYRPPVIVYPSGVADPRIPTVYPTPNGSTGSSNAVYSPSISGSPTYIIDPTRPPSTYTTIYPTTTYKYPTPTYTYPTATIKISPTSYTTNPTPTYTTTNTYPNPTTYTSSTTQPTTYNSQPTTNYPPSPTPHPTVQGVSDSKSWWQVILEFFGR